MRITNEQIIQSARRQRETVNNRMDVAPWSRHQRPRRGFAAVIAIAASFISFIAGYGVRVVISSSCADIHRNNLLNCFVLPVIVSKEFQQELFDSIKANPQTEVKVDVPNQTVTNLATGNSEHFDINSYKKYCLMNAYDDIDFLLANKEKILNFEDKRR